MQNNKLTHLPLAVRAYPVSKNTEAKPSNKRKRLTCPDAMFVFDTETRTDATQRLIFGSYRFIQNGECLEEGIFQADDLSERERNVLKEYTFKYSADTI